jgi:hypothetical protein
MFIRRFTKFSLLFIIVIPTKKLTVSACARKYGFQGQNLTLLTNFQNKKHSTILDITCVMGPVVEGFTFNIAQYFIHARAL